MSELMALKRLFIFLFISVLVTSSVIFAVLLRYDRVHQQNMELYSVEIIGEYSEEGGEWKPLTREVFFQNLTYRDITVRGHFTRDLPENSKLFLNIDHLRAALRVNGVEVYSIGPIEGDGNLTQAVGRQWVTVTSPGITTEDTVELNFGNLYKNAYMIQFDELLWQMHTGDERMMLFEAIRLDAWPLGVGLALLFLTLFLLAISASCGVMRMKGARRFLWLGFTTLFAACWFFTLSSAPTLILPLPVFLNVLYPFSMQGMVVFLVLFIADHLSKWRKHTMTICTVVILAVMQVALINQIIGVQDLYKAIDYFAIFDLLVVCLFTYCIAHEATKAKKREASELLWAMTPLAFFAALELLNGFFQFSRAAVLVGIGMVIFVVVEGIYTLRRIKLNMENEKRMLLLENELQQSNIRIMISQIQPHFLYNSLQGIKQLCDVDSFRASEALEHFAYYLRSNMDSLANTSLIPFVKELEHISDYLYLEKMRFSKKLNIKLDIEYKNFLLPPLTVQPIIENAIRHGLNKKKGGGTLTLRCERLKDEVIITIHDDGQGFDPAEKKEDGRSHLGVENTKKRLETLCGGSLQIESAKGVGTTAKIILPQKEMKE